MSICTNASSAAMMIVIAADERHRVDRAVGDLKPSKNTGYRRATR